MQVLGAVLLVAAVVLAVAVAAAPDRLDASDLPWNRALRSPAENSVALVAVLKVFALVGSPLVATLVGVLFGIALLVLGKRGWTLYFAVVALGGVLITEVTKKLVARERPQWPDPLDSPESYAFPSGHTLSGITMWATAGVILLFAFEQRKWLTFAGWTLVVVGVAMGVSRLLLGVHWLSDVLGGWLFGFGWFFTVTGIVLTRWRGRAETVTTTRS